MIPNIFLTENDIVSIHRASLRVLEEVGIRLDDPEALSLLLANGAFQKDNRLHLPEALVDSSLSQCPPTVTLQGRGESVTLGTGATHVHNLGGARDVFDPATSRLRPAATQDVAESARLMDALPNVTTITPLYTPRDVPAHKMTLVMFVETVKNTLKPVNGPGVHNPAEVRLLAEMIRVVYARPVDRFEGD